MSIDSTAEEINPNIANDIIILVIYGRLKDKTVLLNAEPPTSEGSDPRIKIISALVAHE